MIMIVKFTESQMGFPAAVEGGGEARGGGEGGEWREKWSASGVDVGVDSVKSEIKVERNCDQLRARESEGGKRKWQPSHELLDEEVCVLCARVRA